jgi:hypothetical protein
MSWRDKWWWRILTNYSSTGIGINATYEHTWYCNHYITLWFIFYGIQYHSLLLHSMLCDWYDASCIVWLLSVVSDSRWHDCVFSDSICNGRLLFDDVVGMMTGLMMCVIRSTSCDDWSDYVMSQSWKLSWLRSDIQPIFSHWLSG